MTDNISTASTSSTNLLSSTAIQHHLDTKGLICPEPVMMLHKIIRKADGGDVIEIVATDPASTRDIPNFCRHLGHELLLSETLDKEAQQLTHNSEAQLAADETDEPISYDEVYRYLVKKKLC
ncbi:MAG: sulfurtransferase TusA [Psychrobacter sp.]|nr:sulfurtransferase TusA [Psychrobacter sp.]